MEALEMYTVDDRSDVYTEELKLNLGPQHPSTHGVLRVELSMDGEIITASRCDIGYLHRCAEKIGENVTYLQYTPYTDRMDYLASMNNNLAWSLTVEKLLGVEAPERAQWLRMICAELNRIASHLIAFGTYGIDIGANTPFFYAFRERESIMALLERPSGARMLYNYIQPGGLRRDVDENWVTDVLAFCDDFEKRWAEYNTLLSNNRIFIGRTANIGVIPQDVVYACGATGPVMRGSGIKWDLRRDVPYLKPYEEVDFDVPVGEGTHGTLGDCWDRYWVRMREMMESIRIIRQGCAALPGGEVMEKVMKKMYKTPLTPEAGEAYMRCENPRGELGFYVVAEGGTSPIRCRARAPSFCNLSLLDSLLPGTMIADAVAIIGSLDIVLGEVDR
ncbi:MAG: NADH-quinone oxidoreductase subunit D [Planctomycetota bacterium]|jgi:NADH-quinone oxidoreductase subunit D|nr:NADH-quinone oxidoreductase subunit D [Planctomycetota bacterium]